MATRPCSPGWPGSGRSGRSALKARVPMAPDWPDSSLEPASRSSRSTGPTARTVVAPASPTRSMQSRQPELPCRERAHGHAKSRDGAVEAMRVLVVAKRSARQARVKALTQMRQLTFTAPDQLQCRIKGLPAPQFIAAAQSLAPTRSADPVMVATTSALSSLAHRIGELDEEIAELDAMITPLVQAHAPELLGIYGVGIDTAATLLVTAGDNPERLRSEAPGPTCAGSHRSRPPRAKSPAIGSTGAGTARPTGRSGSSSSPGWHPTRRRRPTWSDG